MLNSFSPTDAPSAREVLATYQAAFNARVVEGTLRPLVFPYHFYGFIALATYLCIPYTKRPWLYKARWAVLAWIVWFQCYTLGQVSSMNMGFAFCAGLISVWGVVWSLTWLVWNRPQFDAKRVERRRGWKENVDVWEEKRGLAGNGGSGADAGKDSILRERIHSNGDTNGHVNVDTGSQAEEKPRETEYYWQTYPAKLTERIDWVLTLLLNFRGPGWNWGISPLPAFPASVKAKLGEVILSASYPENTISSVGLQSFATPRLFIKSRLPIFVFFYFVLDILKVVMMKDTYFILGPNNYPLPAHLSTLSPMILRIYRQVITFLVLTISLEMAFMLAPFAAMIIGPKHLGLRAEPWQYPTNWGSLSLLAEGLPALWGSWWHQTFRFGFTSPTNYLIHRGYIKARSPAAKISALVFAFGISGLLHFGGCISQFGPANPFNAFLFFMLQALGIILQTSFWEIFKPQIRPVPKALRKAGNFAFAVMWLFFTAPWLTDEFARGGIWLYLPIPVSVARGFGYGAEGDGWWCWEDIGVGWYTGRNWWESGISL
ncbi:hypothetical protein B7494_g5552 [Chlorociboria aeruginascens]|nr:hypothetical protein B7494_g5552 [Chlorociboria aeruginascens]